MEKNKKTVSVLLAATMLISLCSCNGNTVTTSKYHGQWIDSNLFENIDKMASANVKDDFAAAVNYEWATQQVEDYTYDIGTFGQVKSNVVQNKRAMIEDESFQNKNIEIVRTAYELYSDWDYRDSLGVEPLMKYFTFIDDIRDIDDVSAYMIDNDRNPFAMSLVELNSGFINDLDDYQVLGISKPFFSLEDCSHYVVLSEDGYKTKEMVVARINYMLGRCGYSDKEIEKTISDCFSFESQLANLSYAGIDSTPFVSLNDVLEMSGNYPLKDMLEHYNMTNCEHFNGDYTYISNLGSVYTQKNIDGIKAYFKVRLALESINYLDSGCHNVFMDSDIDRADMFAEHIDEDPDCYFFTLIQKTSLSAAMDQAYLDYYFDQATYDEIKELIQVIKEKYEILINENENLSDESKKAICEKLYAIKENVFLPTNTADLIGVELKTKAEGGTYLDAMCVFSRIRYEHIGDVVQMKCDRSFWDIYDGSNSTTITNSVYYGPKNSIFIYLGLMTEPYYMPGLSIEEKLGSFAFILAHEISHAFDTNGIGFDKDGKTTNDLISKEDMSSWNQASIKIIGYFSGIEPFEGSGKYNNSFIKTEVIADNQGFKACLMIAKDYEDFDYDLLFRSFASSFKQIITKDKQFKTMKTMDNPHPLYYLRINYTLMQFDEFVETYDIKPGDGMYLDPEQRSLVL